MLREGSASRIPRAMRREVARYLSDFFRFAFVPLAVRPLNIAGEHLGWRAYFRWSEQVEGLARRNDIPSWFPLLRFPLGYPSSCAFRLHAPSRTHLNARAGFSGPHRPVLRYLKRVRTRSCYYLRSRPSLLGSPFRR